MDDAGDSFFIILLKNYKSKNYFASTKHVTVTTIPLKLIKSMSIECSSNRNLIIRFGGYSMKLQCQFINTDLCSRHLTQSVMERPSVAAARRYR